MKIFAPLFIMLLISSSIYCQIGINTTEPSATLDVNGTIRIRDFNSLHDSEAIKIVGMDEEGNLVDVSVGENIILENNELRVVETIYHTYITPLIPGTTIDDYDLLILPGEPNEDYKIMRILTVNNFVNFTGLKAGLDGQIIWLMNYSDRIKLLPLNSGSAPQNQFLINNAITIFKYESVQLVYDATLQKWLLLGR
ncbi:hypothetical protein [Ulvibacter antarcticus]|uniref:Uncharacterized protein n=1 Tax=Ulvibacter antarcticus TaxID=442714 RepID=A0A3L9YFP1_9FLAO|nr:hypothetical protein [Ulvibacter antarcticus]RMA56758.1 hypothetical protein BXY75_3275 [Ulvibacter antarcticus]